MDLQDEIEEVAQRAASTTTELGSSTQQPLPDLIAADRYLAGKDALEGTNSNGGKKSGWRCLRAARAKPPGSV